MKKTDKSAPISKALSEVWEWKDGVYKDIKNMPFEEVMGSSLQMTIKREKQLSGVGDQRKTRRQWTDNREHKAEGLKTKSTKAGNNYQLTSQ